MTFKIDKPTKGQTTEETVEKMFTFLCQMSDLLNYHLNNIDETNCTQNFGEKVEGNNGKLK